MKKITASLLLASIIISMASCAEAQPSRAVTEVTEPSAAETTAATSSTTAKSITTTAPVSASETTTTATSAEITTTTTTATSEITEVTSPAVTTTVAAHTDPTVGPAYTGKAPELDDGGYEVPKMEYVEEEAAVEGDYIRFDTTDSFVDMETGGFSDDIAADFEAGAGGDSFANPGEGCIGEYIEEIQARAGILTGGEWKDNDNWGFWQELIGQRQDWKNISERWEVYPDDRYKITVVSGDKPCEGYTVRLHADGEAVWTAVTDNYGEAYLFNTLGDDKAEVEYIEIIGKDDENGEISSPSHNEVFDFVYEQPADIEKLDLMLMIDTTGSMGDELTYIQKELQDVVERVEKQYANSDLHLSVNFYRDEGDDYVVRSFEFTDNVNKAVTDLRQQFAEGGGDYPEAVIDALDNAVNDHEWREKSTKLCFFVLDAPPHDGEGKKLSKLIASASEKGIRIIPVASSGVDTETEFLCRTMAMATGGTYAFLTDHSGVGGSHLEPTIGDYKVEMLNDMLVRITGDYMEKIEKVSPVADKKDNNEKKEEKNENPPEAFTFMNGMYYEDGGRYGLKMIYSESDAEEYIKVYGEGYETFPELQAFFDKVDFNKYAVAIKSICSGTGSAKCELYGWGYGEGNELIEFDYAIETPEECTDDMATIYLVAAVPLEMIS